TVAWATRSRSALPRRDREILERSGWHDGPAGRARQTVRTLVVALVASNRAFDRHPLPDSSRRVLHNAEQWRRVTTRVGLVVAGYGRDCKQVVLARTRHSQRGILADVIAVAGNTLVFLAPAMGVL